MSRKRSGRPSDRGPYPRDEAKRARRAVAKAERERRARRAGARKRAPIGALGVGFAVVAVALGFRIDERGEFFRS